MIDTQGRRTGELGYEFAVDPMDAGRDGGRYLEYRKGKAERELFAAAAKMVSDGRAYLIKFSDWEERAEDDWVVAFGQVPAIRYRRRMSVVLAKRTDAEVGECCAGLEQLFMGARARDGLRVVVEDGRVYDWNGRAWERTR